MSNNQLTECTECHETFPLSFYYESPSIFFSLGHLPICPNCLLKMIDQSSLDEMDRFFRWADWPFYVERWTQLYEAAGVGSLDSYYHTYIEKAKFDYDSGVDWKSTNDKWHELYLQSNLDSVLPEQQAHEEKTLRGFWEPDGDERYNLTELRYLQKLYDDIERTQNVSTGAQIDQAKKLARLSLDMDNAQRDSKLDLYSKLMKSYVDLIKISEFTPKSSTSSTSFETMGELVLFLEKTGFINKFYDGEERDIVDKTIKNQQMFLRRIVNGDSTLSERIEQRLQRMDLLDKLEDGITPEEEWSYDLAPDDDWIDNNNFDGTVDKDETEEFKEEV